MTTRAKIDYGWVKDGRWFSEDTYLVTYDGYPENILPLITTYSECDISVKYEHLEHFNDVGGVDYIYYIEYHINGMFVTVLEYDWDYFNRYGVDNYRMVRELSF